MKKGNVSERSFKTEQRKNLLSYSYLNNNKIDESLNWNREKVNIENLMNCISSKSRNKQISYLNKIRRSTHIITKNNKDKKQSIKNTL